VSLAELAAAIAPTAAVSGVPRKDAVSLLAEREPWRGRYGGLTGLVDARGDGELYLAIRGVRVRPGALEVTAGAGVVAESDPVLERREIQAKIDAVLEALVDR
jgi:isochorismate synthase EntC